MKKTYILLIFLLFFSTVMLVNTKNVYADGPTTFDITFTSNKPNFNTINNTLTFDYGELGSSNAYVSVTAEISNHETNEFDFEWKNESAEVVSTNNQLLLYKQNSNKKITILVGESKFTLVVSLKNSTVKQQKIVVIKVTDNNDKCKMFLTSNNSQTNIDTSTPPIEISAFMPITAKHSINWYVKTPNSNTYKLATAKSATFSFDPGEYITGENGLGDYLIVATATDSKNKVYYSSAIKYNATPERSDVDIIYEIVSQKAKNTRANVQATTYTLNSTNGLDPTKIFWYVNDTRICSGESMTYEPDKTDEYTVTAKYQQGTNMFVLATTMAKPLPTNIYVYVLCGAGVLLAITAIFAISIAVTNKKRDVVWWCVHQTTFC